MNRTRFIIATLAFIGAGLAGCGLFAPLVTVPVVGAVRFSENILGGVPAARILACVLALASVLFCFGGRPARAGALVGTLAIGLIGGMLLSVYRHAMDQVTQIADLGDGKVDEGVTKLLAQMEYGSGAGCFAVGALLFLMAVCICLWSPLAPVPKPGE